jgi:protein-tyrosine phosphatase
MENHVALGVPMAVVSKMDWIDGNIAVGTIIDAERVSELQESGIDLIIDARVAFISRNIYLPPVSVEPIIPKVLRLADLMVSLTGQGVKTLIHCTFGVDRTPFVAMVYVSKRASMSYEQAYNYVKEKRPQTVFHWDWVKLLRNDTKRK